MYASTDIKPMVGIFAEIVWPRVIVNRIRNQLPGVNDWQGACLKINDLVNNNKITKKDLIKSINDILWESCKI